MTSRAVATCTVTVARRPDEVFAYLCDANRHGEWSPKAYRVEGLTDTPIRMGTTWTSYGWVPRDPQHRNEVEVTDLSAPTRLRLVSIESGEEFINTFTLTPEGPGTRVERVMDLPRPGGMLGAVFPLLMKGLVKPGVQKGLTMLKTNLESQRGSVATT